MSEPLAEHHHDLSRPTRHGWAAGHRLTVVLGIAALVRFGCFFAFPSVFDFVRTGRIHGSDAYDTYARNLLDTGVYGLRAGVPDAALPPLYSVLLAAVYAVLGRGALQVAALHVGFDLLTIALLYQLAVGLMPEGPTVGVLAGLALACYPYLVFQGLTVTDTPLFVALLLAFLLLMVRVRERVDWDRGTSALAAAGGLVLGLAMLTRPILPPLAALIAVWFLFRRSLRQTVARVGMVALVAGLVVAVWLGRNQAVYHAFVPVATNAGSNFWQGNNPATLPYLRAGWDVQWADPGRAGPSDPGSREADAELFRRAWRYLREDPGRIGELVWVKFLTQWSLDVSPRRNPVDGRIPRVDGQGRVVLDPDGPTGATDDRPGSRDPVPTYSSPLFERLGRRVHRVYWGGLLLLALVGSVMTRRWWREVSLVWLVQLGLTLVYVVFHPSTRYRVPGDPLLFLLSAYPVAWLVRRNGGRTGGDAADGCCWIGGARYAQPLDAADEKKWRTLAGLGTPMHVIAFARDRTPRRFTQHAHFYLLPRPRTAVLRHLTMLFGAPPLALWLVLRRGVSVLIAQSPHAGGIAVLVQALARPLGRRVALVVESHGDFVRAPFLYGAAGPGRLSRRPLGWIARCALRRADVLRAVSDSIRRQIQAYAPGMPVEQLMTWTDAEAFLDVERERPLVECHDVLFAGLLVPLKGVHVLLEAYAHVAGPLPRSRLVICGGIGDVAYRERLRRRVAEIGLADRVVFTGEVPRAELARLMGRARVVVLPSSSEGLARVLVEAMMCGTPVIGSRIGGIVEVVRDGETGRLVPAGDVGALAVALAGMLTDPGIEAMGRRAREVARAVFSAEAYLEGHRRVLARARARLAGG